MLGFWFTELLECNDQILQVDLRHTAECVLDDGLVQPSGLPDGHAAGDDAGTPGLGPGLGHPAQ